MKNVDLLKSMDVFAGLSEDDLNRIADLLKEKKLSKDTIIFRQGEAGDALYVILGGRVRCTAVDAVGREKVMGFFTEGQSFGEMGLLTGEPRSATMQAVTDVRVLMLRKDDFDSFLDHNVQVMLHMMKVIARRQAATNVRLSRGPEAVDVTGPAGKIFTIFSPKGGVGKTTLAVNLAVELARLHAESVVLVDLSLTFGHTMLLLNLAPRSSLASTSADALQRMDMQEGLAFYMVTHPSSTLRLLVGATRPEEGEAVTGDTVKVALEQLKKHFSYVIVDTGSVFTDPVLAALEFSDKVLMLCSPEISVLRDIRDCQRIFNDVVKIPRDRTLYLMNYIFPFKTLSKEQFETALQQELFAELPYGADVPSRAALRGEAFVERQAGSNISKAIQKLAAQLSAEKAKAGVGAGYQEKKRGFFR